jgi:type IV secretory pathway TraG/TraD family ATPase VirD4
MSSLHGTPVFLILLAISAIFFLIGMGGFPSVAGLLRLPVVLVVNCFLSMFVCALISEWMQQKGVPKGVVGVFGFSFIACFSFFAGKWWLIKPKEYRKRGSSVTESKGRRFWEASDPNCLRLAGMAVPEADETKHFKMIGTTGTGKSTAIRELIGAALDRGDRAVIADPDGSYMRSFYDAGRGDQILNPFDSRATRWDLFGEITRLYDADQLSRSLISDTEGPESSWRNYARIFLTSLLRQLHRVKHDDVAELYQLISTTPVEDLRDLLADTPAGPYLSGDNGRFFAAVRAVANTHLGALEHIAQQASRDSLSVRNWVRTGHGVLFLPYSANEIATLRSIISTWMRLAIFETMSQAEDPNRRLWFVVDELDALGQIDGLKDALARLRKFGGRCVLGFQSIAQVSGTYGRSEAQTIVENCGNTLILRSSSSEGGGTALFASSLIGEREIVRKQISTSDVGSIFSTQGHNTINTSVHHIMESAVLASEIEQLPDLHGFLKLASQPDWRRVKLSMNSGK